VRLETDFIVFWGSQYESTDQLLKGVLVFCLQSPLRLEEISLSLDGTFRQSWTPDPGIAHKTTILHHRWPSFVGKQGKSVTLPAGNYEWPFEYMIPGDTPESVEGMSKASIIYHLKATINRGKLMRQLCTAKQFRIIRTLPPGALEFMHTMSVEDTWVDKVDYSLAIPTKAAVFGGSVTLEMRFTPLAKGLELGVIAVTLMEIGEFSMHSRHHIYTRAYRTERTVSSWNFEVSRERDWQDTIEDTSQEGWVLSKKLDLPKRLRECIQDLDVQGIKVRHKLKVNVSLNNRDGHVSQLDTAFPIDIFISPNIALNEQGDLVQQVPSSTNLQPETSVPPGYGDHVLDLLYEDIDGWQRPGDQLESNTLACTGLEGNTLPIIDPAFVGTEHGAMADGSVHHSDIADNASQNSSESSGLDEAELAELSKVPTYRTAVRTPLRSHTQQDDIALPDYETASRQNN
ncbi:hypothetical protein B0J13DRAFT_639261, partial [Dactylonectria estremocensis]